LALAYYPPRLAVRRLKDQEVLDVQELNSPVTSRQAFRECHNVGRLEIWEPAFANGFEGDAG
jgi:hypothetical protein